MLPDDEGVLKGWVRIKLRDDAQALRVGTFTRGAMESGDPEAGPDSRFARSYRGAPGVP